MRTSNKNLLAAITLSSALALSGCGKQAFVSVAAVQAQQAPGTFTIPAKVDILLVVDDTGSMYDAGPLTSQIPQFLSGIQNSGWDYHFATVPLTTNRPITQVMASQYDSNWGAAWMPPYPGAQPNGPGTVSPSAFTPPSQYNDYAVLPSNVAGGQEPGLKNILAELQSSSAQSTGFLRSDAMRVVLVLGNGADTSDLTICTPSGSVPQPFELTGNTGNCIMNGVSQSNPSATGTLSFNNFKAGLQNLNVKFYAAMFPYRYNIAYETNRYSDMTTSSKGVGGQYFDLTQVPLSSVLTSLSGSLQAQRLAMETAYLFINAAPDVTTIQVTKYVNGVPQIVPQSTIDPQTGQSTDGWSYVGYGTHYAIDYPIPMNSSTGYAIQLNGVAKLHGSDTATVTFKNQGATNSGI